MVSRLQLLAITSIGPAVWGSTYIVTTELLPPDRPLLSATLRALPAGLAILVVRRVLPSGGLWWKAAVLGALNIGVFQPLLFVSAYRLPGGVAATLGAVGPLLAALLAWRLLGEPLLVRRIAAGVAGVVGVALLVLGAAAELDLWGVLAGLAGTASMTLGTVLTRRWVRGVDALDVTAWQLTAGGLLLVPLTFLLERGPTEVTVEAVVGWTYLSVVGGGIAYALWFRGLARLPASAAAFLPLLSPLVAAMLGLALLGEQLTGRQWLGFAIALAAMAAGSLVGRTRPGRARTVPPTGRFVADDPADRAVHS